MQDIFRWTFSDERAVPEEVNNYLIEGEEARGAYFTVRDYAVFTNYRLIVVDSQGLTGKKKEVYSVPYNSILMWSVENAGTLDFNSEVEMKTKMGTIKINLGRKVDVANLNRLIAYSLFK